MLGFLRLVSQLRKWCETREGRTALIVDGNSRRRGRSILFGRLEQSFDVGIRLAGICSNFDP